MSVATDPSVAEQISRSVDARALANDLRHRTEAEVRFSDGDRALYAVDSSNYRHVPLGVVLPRSVDDIVGAVAVAHEYGAPVTMRGGGTGLAGQTCNEALVIDCSKYLRRVVSYDAASRSAVVEPGCVPDELNVRAMRDDLTFPAVPATHRWCTFGGMIGNNSCGMRSVMGGRTVDNVLGLDVLTYDGERMRVGPTSDDEYGRIVSQGGRRAGIYVALRTLIDRYKDLVRERFPKIPRRVSGYSLPALLPENGFNVARALVGSEGTCVVVLSATVRLVPIGPHRALAVLGYPDVYAAGDAVPRVLEHKPTALEGMDDLLIDKMTKKGLHPHARKHLVDGKGWLLVELDGRDRAEARAKAEKLVREAHAPASKVIDDEDEQARIWEIREGGLGATAWNHTGDERTWEGWEDSAVPPDRFGDYMRDLRKLYERYGYDGVFYGHFGDGCLHTRIDFDLQTARGITHFRHFLDDAADICVGYGGSLSGEHGDGQSKAALLPKMFGGEIVDAFGEFKRIWDPDGRMNPGKVVDPRDPSQDLRLGAGYVPKKPETHFAFPDDDRSFGVAALRCVGVGKCRIPPDLEGHEVSPSGKTSPQTMCPSFMVTREEKHSTRGRARLLFEMLEGDPLEHGWKDEAVRDALDLCLACKGCKGDCPVQVDMATYKAEFLSHYFEGRPRPRQAYAFGLIMLWSRFAMLAPGLVNTLGAAPITGSIAKALMNVHPRRSLPRFAAHTFRSAFRRDPADAEREPVVLWADTFNENFHPDTLGSAVTVLRAAGYWPIVPRSGLCCGRPLYDYGFLDLAKKLLRQILSTMRREIRAGMPFVVLEPSCAAVFRDELRSLFPDDPDARRLHDQTVLLSELLARDLDRLPRRDGGGPRAIVHGHCHQKALMGMEHEMKVLEHAGVDARLLDTDCCGMAGAFGFEREHYDVSMGAGERRLLPEARHAELSTLVIADGFSCREQLRQGAQRHAVHLASALAGRLP